MVIRWLLLLAFTSGAYAGSASGNHWTIRDVFFEENGAWSDQVSSDETVQSCADFVLSESEVKQYFAASRDASEREYDHDLDMSRCFAGGRISFSDGREALWKIDRARRGRMIFPDKSERFFYCETCENSKFDDACDDECMSGLK